MTPEEFKLKLNKNTMYKVSGDNYNYALPVDLSDKDIQDLMKRYAVGGMKSVNEGSLPFGNLILD